VAVGSVAGDLLAGGCPPGSLQPALKAKPAGLPAAALYTNQVLSSLGTLWQGGTLSERHAYLYQFNLLLPSVLVLLELSAPGTLRWFLPPILAPLSQFDSKWTEGGERLIE
jgi:hypothetical protein